MSDRTYRAGLGLLLLFCLYYDLRMALLVIISLVFFEAISNQRIPQLVNRLRGISQESFVAQDHVGFEAERAWRLVVACGLTLSVVFFTAPLWWVSWFMGFAIFGAGLSGVCPMLITLQKIGFR